MVSQNRQTLNSKKLRIYGIIHKFKGIYHVEIGTFLENNIPNEWLFNTY